MARIAKKKLPVLPLKRRVEQIIRELDRVYPDAKLELKFSNPLELLVALMLAAQARDDLVNQVTPGLFEKFRTAADYTRLPADALENEIRRINFYRNKARLIQNCCREIVDRFRGAVPSDLDDLLTLPGVGRKTANILLGNAFGQDAIGVDTHVMRLSQRLGLSRQTNADKIEFDLTSVVFEKKRTRLCHLFQYHGRRVCVAKKPKCQLCVIEPLCPYPEKTV